MDKQSVAGGKSGGGRQDPFGLLHSSPQKRCPAGPIQLGLDSNIHLFSCDQASLGIGGRDINRCEDG